MVDLLDSATATALTFVAPSLWVPVSEANWPMLEIILIRSNWMLSVSFSFQGYLLHAKAQSFQKDGC